MEERSVDSRASELGVPEIQKEDSYLDRCARVGNLYLTSGHTSKIAGTLGEDLDVEAGKEAAREATRRLLGSVRNTHGTLEGIRLVRLLTCVRADSTFSKHPEVANAASDLVHEIFGRVEGHHARSALGLASLPGGAAVEVEAILEITSK